MVTGTIHSIPDGSTAQCAADLLTAYNYVNTLAPDIELLYPAQFGNNLVLTPHTYLMGGAATLTDTVFLNGQGVSNAVFVIQINGALSTSTYSKVKLINGTQAQNVYWKVEGAVTINNYSLFCGTIICHNGALGAINTGVTLNGQALTTSGALSTDAITATAQVVPGNCATVGIETLPSIEKEMVSIFPNPFGASATIVLSGTLPAEGTVFKMYNVLGEQVMNTLLINQTNTLNTDQLPSGIYFYEMIRNNKTIQTGKLVSQQ